METFKSILFTFVSLAIIFLIGFWAVTSMESGSDHVKGQELKELKNINAELEKEVARLTTENSFLSSEKEQQVAIAEKIEEEKIVEEKTPEPTKPKVVTLKYQSLINELQALVNKNIILDDKSAGPSVGTIQKFFNIYNKTSYRVDNDFGAKTETAVKDFQKDMGLSADGGVGKTTLLKMIDWLKKQG